MAPALLHVAALALRASTIVSSCPALPTCPQDDKCTFGANNDVFQVSCGTDFYGGDLVLSQVSLQVILHSLSFTLSGTDFDAGILYDSLLEDQQLCCGQLRWRKLLHEANTRGRPSKVWHFPTKKFK
jgi:hypothetical protein